MVTEEMIALAEALISERLIPAKAIEDSQFLDGSAYAYKGVQEHEFENLKTAPSVGSYFNRNYKNVYPYERA